MDRLVARAKAENAQSKAERDRAKEEKHQREIELLLEEERQRVEGLRRMISSWWEAMAAADYPCVQPITIATEEVKKGLFGSRVEHHSEEVAGWRVGRSGYAGNEDSPGHFWSIYLLADCRLVRDTHPTVAHELGSGFRISESYDGPKVDQRAVWYEPELTIPENLRKIAEQAKVVWNPDE